MNNNSEYKCIEDILEDCDIETENKWNELIPKDIENVINGFLFDPNTYYYSYCNGDTKLYKEVKNTTIYFKSGRRKGQWKSATIIRCRDIEIDQNPKWDGNWRVRKNDTTQIYITNKGHFKRKKLKTDKQDTYYGLDFYKGYRKNLYMTM